MRVIDFRLRPPFGAFADLIVFRDPARTARLARELGFEIAPSVREPSPARSGALSEASVSYRVRGSKFGYLA